MLDDAMEEKNYDIVVYFFWSIKLKPSIEDSKHIVGSTQNGKEN